MRTLVCLLAALLAFSLLVGCVPEGKTVADFLPASSTEPSAPQPTASVTTPKPLPTPASTQTLEPLPTPTATPAPLPLPFSEPSPSPSSEPSPLPSGEPGSVSFQDTAFELAVRDYLELPDGSIALKDLAAITEMHISSEDIPNAPASGRLVAPNVHSLADLALFSGLEALTVENMRNPDLAVLQELRNLSSLTLRACPKLVSLDSVPEQLRLTQLVIADCTDLSDIGGIRYLSSLTDLDITNTRISSLKPLSLLSKLLRLRLYGCRITDITPLSTLTQLQALAIGDNFIRDISPLTSLVALRGLDMYSNDVTNIDAVSKLPLELLSVSNNPVSSLRPIFGLTQLEYLDVSNTKATSLKGLEKLQLLKEFSALGMPPAELSALSKLPKLSSVTLDAAQAAKHGAALNERGITIDVYNK